MRVGNYYAEMEDVYRFRGIRVGIMLVRPILYELVAYFYGRISPNEFHALECNITRAKRRQYIQAATSGRRLGIPIGLKIIGGASSLNKRMLSLSGQAR